MKKTCRNQNGWAMIDALLAIVFTLMLIPVVSMYLKQSSETVTKSATAQQMKQIQTAVARYTKDNYQTILLNCTNTTAYEVLPSALVPSYLPILPNKDADPVYGRNPYNQAYHIFFLQPTVGNIQTLVITVGGRGSVGDSATPDFINIDVPGIAGMVGAAGGVVVGAVTDAVGHTPRSIIGAFGSWSLNLAATTIPGLILLEKGHLALNLFFDKGQLVTDYLDRYNTGNPEVNTMRTDLNMGANDINNAKNITASNDVNADTVNATTAVNTMDVNASNTVNSNVVNVASSVNTLNLVSTGAIQANKLFVESRNVVLSDLGTTLDTFLPRYVPRGAVVVQDGSLIPKPACFNDPNITAKVILSPAVQHSAVVPTAEAPYFSTAITSNTVEDNGAFWTVKLKMVNPYGYGWITAQTRNNSGVFEYSQALATVYCDNNYIGY
jgi:hypothetical protein